jgi:hypothetical protein
MSNNETDKKVTIKRRGDGVYDIYLNDDNVGHRGSIEATTEFVAYLLAEELN